MQGNDILLITPSPEDLILSFVSHLLFTCHLCKTFISTTSTTSITTILCTNCLACLACRTLISETTCDVYSSTAPSCVYRTWNASFVQTLFLCMIALMCLITLPRTVSRYTPPYGPLMLTFPARSDWRWHFSETLGCLNYCFSARPVLLLISYDMFIG